MTDQRTFLQRIELLEAETARQGRLLVSIDKLTAALFDERDRLREALALVYFHLGPPQPQIVGHAEIPALVERAMAGRDRMRDALVIGHKMMGTMRGPANPPDQSLWEQFEIMLADLCNDGLLDTAESTANG